MQYITKFTFGFLKNVYVLLWIEINTEIKHQSVIHIPIVISHQENAVYQLINQLINSKLKKNQSWKNSQSFKYNFINNQTDSESIIEIMINTSRNRSLFWKKNEAKKILEAKFEARPIFEARPKFGLRPK